MRVGRLVSALVVVLVIAAAGAYLGFARTADTYESRAALLVVPPADPAGTSAGDQNPFLQIDDSVARLALVVASQMDSDAVRDEVEAVGGDGSYTATALGGDTEAGAAPSPVVSLSATAVTRAGAQRAVNALVDKAGEQLAAVQAESNVAEADQARVVVSSPASAGEIVRGPQIRAAAVLGAAVGLVALLLAALVLSRSRPEPAAAAVQAPPPVRERPGSAADRRPENQAKRRGPVFHDRRASDAGRFAAPMDDPQPEVAEPSATAPRRQELLRQMVREDWQRSGSNVPWSRREQRDAYLRAEERLAEKEQQRRRLDERVRRLDDDVDRRDLG